MPRFISTTIAEEILKAVGGGLFTQRQLLAVNCTTELGPAAKTDHNFERVTF